MSVAKTSSVQVWVAVVREVNHGPFEPRFRHLPMRLNKYKMTKPSIKLNKRLNLPSRTDRVEVVVEWLTDLCIR